jgi:hypothetical protein
MKRALTLSCAIVAILVMGAWADDKKEEPKSVATKAAKHAGLERFKQLAGEWVGKDSAGAFQEVRVSYKVTAAGSAVVETIFPGQPFEMITVYHADGDDLVLTHYCAAGNQPRMKAERGTDANKFAFKFAGATNLKSENDMHMHDATFTFPDNDTIVSEWTHFKDNKSAGVVKFELTRKK